MNIYFDPKEQARMSEARESFSGRLLTNAQFDEAMIVTTILEREIAKSGSFKEKLGDYAYAMSRSEKMDVMKAETIIRDLFKARTGQTMNQMREELMEREKTMPRDARDKAYQYAADIGDMVRDGNKMSFFRAQAHQAEMLAREFRITDAGARGIMAEAFKAAEGRELADWGKELDDQHYRPQIEAEKAEREKTSRSKGEAESPARSDADSSPSRGSYHQPPRRNSSRPRP